MTLELNLNWTTYWNIVLLITVWNLGFFAITRKGKLLYFILKFFEQKKKDNTDRFPDLIKDPIVSCITCMASVHGLIHYSLQCLYHKWDFNPLELIVCAVPVAFLGELIWKIKMLIEKKTP